MTLPAFASIDELADRVPGGVSDDNSARAQAALDDASSLVREVAGIGGDAWFDDDQLADDIPDILKTVTLRSALRVFVNPTEVTQSATGPFSVSRVANAYLTAAEKAMISKAAGKVSGLGVISTTRGCIETPSVGCSNAYGVADEYLPVDPAGEEIPFL